MNYDFIDLAEIVHFRYCEKGWEDAKNKGYCYIKMKNGEEITLEGKMADELGLLYWSFKKRDSIVKLERRDYHSTLPL